MSAITRCYDLYLKRKDPLKYAKRIGVQIGKDCLLNGSPNWGSEPWLIKIGTHSEISFECAFVTHDGATWVFRNQEKYKDVIRFGGIKIGDDCFIGARTTILPGVSIGDNCIVGACSLVNKSIPAGEVWGGVPAHFICKTTEYAEKCLVNHQNYDRDNLKKNKKEEVMKVLNWR